MKKDKMKLAGLLLAIACVSCGAGGVVAGSNAGNNVVVQAEETVEYTTYTITKIGVAGTQAAEAINIYSLAGDALPKDKGNWNDVYTFEAGSGAGVMLNGTALTGIKQPGDLYVPLGKMPEEGDVLTFDGVLYNATTGMKFVFNNCKLEFNGTKWVDYVEYTSYRVTAIGSTKDSSAKALYLYSAGGDEFPKEQGDWDHVYTPAAGATVKLNDTVLAHGDMKLPGDLYLPLNAEAVAGDIVTVDGTFYNAKKAIKLVFDNCQVQYTEEGKWVTVANVQYTTYELGALAVHNNSNGNTGNVPKATQLYMKRADDQALPYASWDAKFALVSGGWTLNGNAITLGNLVCAGEGLFIDLGAANVQVGDVLTVSGTFAWEAETAKLVIKESKFIWTGSVWTKYTVEPTTYNIGKLDIDGGSSAKAIYFKKANGTNFEVADGSWKEQLYFLAGTGVGVTFNGTALKVKDCKIPNNMYLGLEGNTAKAGDELVIGGTFFNGALAVKYVIEETTFVFDGEAWAMKAVEEPTPDPEPDPTPTYNVVEVGKVASYTGKSAAGRVYLKPVDGNVTWCAGSENFSYESGTGFKLVRGGNVIAEDKVKIANRNDNGDKDFYLEISTDIAFEVGDVITFGGTYYNENYMTKYVFTDTELTWDGTAWVEGSIEEPTPDPEPDAGEYTEVNLGKLTLASQSSTAGNAQNQRIYVRGANALVKVEGVTEYDTTYVSGTQVLFNGEACAYSRSKVVESGKYFYFKITVGGKEVGAEVGDKVTIGGVFVNEEYKIKYTIEDTDFWWNGSAWQTEEYVEETPVEYTIYTLGEMVPHANSVTNNNPRATQLYMKRADGQALPFAPATWDTKFTLESGDGWKVNGVSVTVGKLISTNAGLFADISNANIKVGDVLTVSGTFTCESEQAKYVISESKFTWNGVAWEKYVYVEYATHEVGSMAFHQVSVASNGDNYIYFVRADGKGFPIPDDGNTGWTASFTCKSGVGITLNGEAIKAGVKFPGGGSMFVNVYDKAPQVGDELKVGGTFFNSSVAMEIVVAETTFKWDGSAWVVQGGAVTPDPDPTPDPDVPAVPDIEFTTYTVTKVGANRDSSANVAYLYATEGDDLPKDKGNWDNVYAYAPGASIKLNNTAITATIKMPGDLYIPLGMDANAGDILTINGKFYNADNAVMIVFENCQLKWDGATWVAVDSPVTPDPDTPVTPENPTEWTSYNLGNVTVHKHSLENGAGVAATKLYFQTTAFGKTYPVNDWHVYFTLASGDGWKLNGNDVTVGNLISADNHLYISLTDANVQVGDKLTVSGTFVSETKMVKYVIESGTFIWNGTYWENYIEYESYEIGSLRATKWDGTNNYMWLRGSKDPMDGSIPKPNDGNTGWTATFKWKDGAGVQINGKEVAAAIKYPGEFFMALPKAPKVGDVLTIGGTFYNDDLVLAYIVDESSFMWDGNTWVPVVDYTDYEVEGLVAMPNQTATNAIDVKKADNGNFEVNGAFAYLGGSGTGITINGETINTKEISVYGNMLTFMIDPVAKEGDVLTIGGTFYNVQNATRYIISDSAFVFENGSWTVYESNYTEVGLGEVTVLVDASTEDYIYLVSKKGDLELPVNSWDDEFAAYGLGVTLNGQAVDGVVILSVDNALYLELPESAEEGDELVIGGKFVCETQGVLYYVTETSFTWTGMEWEGVVVYETKTVGKVNVTGTTTSAGKLTVKGTGMSNESFEMKVEKGIGFTVNGVSKEATMMNNGGTLVFSFDDVQAGDIVKIGGTFYSKAAALKYVIEESTFVWDGSNWSVKYEQCNVGPVVIIVTSTSAQDLYLAPANEKLFLASGWEAPLTCVSGGITVDGKEIDMNNTVKVPDVGTIFVRLTSSSEGVANGSVVVIGGVFRCASTGIEYIIEESSFLYENGAWKNLLDTTKNEKVAALNDYLATFTETDYYVTEWSVIQQIVVDAKNAITMSISKYDVEDLYNAAIAAMDDVATKAEWDSDSESIKAAAKAELDSYVDATLYREADAAIIIATLAQAKADIDAATNWAAINDAKLAAKAAIDALWTAAEWEAAEAVVAAAKAELDSYKNVDDYLPAEQLALQNIIAAAYADIDAAIGNDTAIANIVKDAKARMDAVKTAEQVEAEQMVVLQAKAELESYKSQDNYNAAEWSEIQTILANAYANIDAAIGDDASIANIVANAKAAMDKVLTSEEADAKAFADAKYEAQQEIKDFVNSLDYDLYSDEAMAEITAFVEAANAAIEEVTDIDGFAVIVAELKANVESVEKLPTTDVNPYPEKPSLIDQIMGAIPGCSGVVGGIAGGVAALGIAAVTLLKKKEDDEE